MTQPTRPSGPGYSGEQRTSEFAGGFGRGPVYCVRTCDGRYFQLQNNSGTTPADLCHAFCPATKTMVFSGSKIDSAVAPNGVRYSDLDSAFLYRTKVIDSCTCNGRDAFGLAHVDLSNDGTLRPGDIVARNDGLASYNGRSKGSEFTPINTSSAEWAQRLAEVKIDPAPASEKMETAAVSTMGRQAFDQASRTEQQAAR